MTVLEPLLLVAIAFQVAPGPASAQEPQAVRTITESGGTAADIVMDPAFRIEGSGAGPLGFVVMNSDSTLFAVVEAFNPDRVVVYDGDGGRVRELGRVGQGPGEFGNIIYITAVGDSVFVYDNRHGRETVYGFGGELHGTNRTPRRVWRAVPFESDMSVINAVGTEADQIGAPFHVFEGGDYQMSFPESGGRFRMDEAFLTHKAMARHGPQTFWAAWPTAYRVDLWTTGGELLLRVDREVEWFPAHEEPMMILPDREPAPRLRDVYYDQDSGLLWVLTHVADDRWADQFHPDRPADMAFNGDTQRYRDSRVEVLDVETGRVLASQRYDTAFAAFSNAGHLAAYWEEDGGEPYIEVYVVELRWRRSSVNPGRSDSK